MRLALLLLTLLLFALVLPRPASADDTAAAESLPMDGPWPTLDDLCRARDFDPAVCSAPPTHCGAAGRQAVRAAPPFREARVIQWTAACDFALRTDAGWWVTSDRLPALDRFLHNGGRYDSEIDRLSMPDGGDGAFVARGTFVHWTSPEKMAWLKHPPFAEWYECEERVVVCAVGDSGRPSCTAPVATGYTVYCRAAAPPHRALHHPVAGVDFHQAAKITRSELRLTGAPRRADGPLPGWYVVAMDAERRRDERRPLAPPRLALHFP